MLLHAAYNITCIKGYGPSPKQMLCFHASILVYGWCSQVAGCMQRLIYPCNCGLLVQYIVWLTWLWYIINNINTLVQTDSYFLTNQIFPDPSNKKYVCVCNVGIVPRPMLCVIILVQNYFSIASKLILDIRNLNLVTRSRLQSCSKGV